MSVKPMTDEDRNELIGLRRDFHKFPELSMKETRTNERIREYLDQWGIEYRTGIAGTGIVGIIRGGSEGATVGLRADMDALPIKEANAVDYASANEGVMHACGHDVHMTILLGAAKQLKKMEKEMRGNIKLFFQPAEEATGGAKRMIEAGCLQNPRVDCVIGLHVMPYLDAGKIEIKHGQLYANTGNVIIDIKGKQGHAAYPDKSVDAIVIAGYIITALQTLVSRSVSPLDSVVLTIGKITGGEKSNIISESARLEGTLRTLDTETRERAKKTICAICENAAAALGGSAEVAFQGGYHALVNDDSVVDIIKEAAIEVVGEKDIAYKASPSMGGDDFSYFTEEVPGAFYHLGCGNPGKGIVAPLHSNYFQADEDCIKVGVEMQVASALRLLDYFRDKAAIA